MPERWPQVDAYIEETVVHEPQVVIDARAASVAAGLPDIAVTPAQGKMLELLTRMVGGKRVLEFGTLAGVSTIHFARAVGTQGKVVTLEIDPHHARTAQANFERAGVADRIELIIGKAAETAQTLSERPGLEPFDLTFIDADKPSNAAYVELAVKMSRPGSVIVLDNCVRSGDVIDAHSSDVRVHGSRSALELIGSHPRLDATVIQTVGSKGHDGFAFALVV